MTSYKKVGIVLFMTNTHEITYKNPPVKNQNDPSWFTETGHDWVCSVSNGIDTINIFCDGILLIEDTQTLKQIKGLSDLYEAGVFNDEQLYNKSSSGKLEWVHNSWFDLYNEEWLDCVEYDLQEAINIAKSILDDNISNTDITESD